MVCFQIGYPSVGAQRSSPELGPLRSAVRMPLYASGLQSHLGNLAVIEVLGKNARPPTVRDRQAFSQTTDFGATDDGCTIQLSEGRPPLAVGSAV